MPKVGCERRSANNRAFDCHLTSCHISFVNTFDPPGLYRGRFQPSAHMAPSESSATVPSLNDSLDMSSQTKLEISTYPSPLMTPLLTCGVSWSKFSVWSIHARLEVGSLRHELIQRYSGTLYDSSHVEEFELWCLLGILCRQLRILQRRVSQAFDARVPAHTSILHFRTVCFVELVSPLSVKIASFCWLRKG